METAEVGGLLEHLYLHQSRRIGSWGCRISISPRGVAFCFAHNSAIDSVRRKRLLGDNTDRMVLELSRLA